ncbi:MBL fold metallo-hydrolase [Haladaptatus sp. GCM10025707]|uniref:MBL fold metallo-hydrolase n=1 Tax=unclassified Haladaptatus TaxID=2622732 RepID=UPI0023E8976B|nr:MULTISPECIES: MBL fold metallo-hydrolase [unclassified Haladaptatus]
MTNAVTAAGLEPLSESLYRYRDSCNAYAVVDGDAALIIDPGSGEIGEVLADAGVETVEWALHTHHHRDQCWGTDQLVERGAKVAVPEHERFLFDDVETFWSRKRLYDNYNDRNTFFTRGSSLPVDETLDDYETFAWRDYEFTVIPAKGHTGGSSTLLATIDGQRVAFCGDLMRAGGHLHDLHSMEYEYSDMKGVVFTIQSLNALESAVPNLVCPGHGDVIHDPEADVDKLRRRLMRLVDLGPHGDSAVETLGVGSRAYLPEMRMVQVSDHLLWGGPWTCSNFYVLLSESGKALFVDYGHSLREHMMIGREREDMERMRFVEHHLDELREEWGVTDFDVVIPTHIHDDHTVGIPHLQRHYDVDCWSLDEVAKVIEDPAAWSAMPCVIPEPIDVARTFTDGATFTWEEYEFTIHHAPGQTEYHAVVATEVDGRTVAFTGDNYFEGETVVHPDRNEQKPHQTTVLRNSFQFWMHEKCKEVMREVQPDRICPGHGEVLDADPLDIEEYCDFIDRKESVFRDLVPEPEAQAVDLFWARLLPYQQAAAPGDSVEYTLLVRNNFGEPTTVGARLRDADGEVLSERRSIALEPDDEGELALSGQIPDDADSGRRVLTAELFVEGESKGPVVEAIVHVE